MTDLQDLVTLRNELINKPLGDVLFNFIHDFITEEACKCIDSREIKGMCRLAEELKKIPSKLEAKSRK